MCSINGCVDFQHPERVDIAAVEAARVRMHRRGPDGHGGFDGQGVSLRHNRLAVMDPAGGKFMDMTFYPREYFCPMDYYTGKKTITKTTYSIHHYCASWTSAVTKRTTMIKRIIGVRMYDKLYGKFLHIFKWLEW